MITPLIDIANGGLYTPEKLVRRHFFSVFPRRIPGRFEFGLYDQLLAVESLGESRNPQALNYLEAIYNFRTKEQGPHCFIAERKMPCFYHEGIIGDHDIINFGLARGPLKDALTIIVSTGMVFEWGLSFRKQSEVREICKDEEVHSIIKGAIEKLHKSLK